MSDGSKAGAMTGGCLCGAVRYEVSGKPVMGGHCYCLCCQKLSGAGHAFHVMVQESDIRVFGEPRGFTWTADSGNAVTTSFCPTCGSPLFGRSSGFPGMVTLRAASLDAPGALEAGMAVYAKRCQPWDRLDPNIPSFDGMPPKI